MSGSRKMGLGDGAEREEVAERTGRAAAVDALGDTGRTVPLDGGGRDKGKANMWLPDQFWTVNTLTDEKGETSVAYTEGIRKTDQ